jgi:hypothetical protein
MKQAALETLNQRVATLENVRRRIMGWHPIDKAPRDRWARVMFADGLVETAEFQNGYWVDPHNNTWRFETVGGRDVILQPTHFLPGYFKT